VDVVTDKTPPIENQIIGYNEAQDQSSLKSAKISYVDSSGVFQKVSNGERIFVVGVKDSIPGFSFAFQDNQGMFIKEDNAMYVQHITVHVTVDIFKKKLDSIYRSTESPRQFYSIRDNIKNIILKDHSGREGEEQMQSKDVWNDKQAYDRSFSFPKMLEHDKHSEEVHTYAAIKVTNVFVKDELTLAQAKNISGMEWPQWQEATRKEVSSLI
jgi:hypothetical protein